MSRSFVPPSARGVGVAPDCGEFYDQPHLPLLRPGIGVPGGPPPDQRQRFHAFNALQTPAAGTTNALVVSYTVPNGHEGRVVGLLVSYVGTGFTEGIATLLYFSLRINGTTYVQQYDVIPNTLGSLTAGPWPIPAAIRLAANDTIEVLVTVPLASTITVGGTTRCHGHLVGFYRPIGAL